MKNALLLSTVMLLAGLSGCLSEETLEAFPEFELADHAGATHNNSMYEGTPYICLLYTSPSPRDR